MEGQIETLSRTISDSKSVLNSMSNTSSDLRDELEDLEDALDRLESTGDLRDVLSACSKLSSKLSGSLVSLRNALGVTGSTVKKDTTEAIDNVQGVGSKTIEQLKAAHSAYASDPADLLYPCPEKARSGRNTGSESGQGSSGRYGSRFRRRGDHRIEGTTDKA